jgi:hypothetical protein
MLNERIIVNYEFEGQGRNINVLSSGTNPERSEKNQEWRVPSLGAGNSTSQICWRGKSQLKHLFQTT